jgi:alkanesulfonate monooxygenase SsuD/methylene tetrahydromethanopterin reductase-like flavin-dependent oxidoreductase (luciferase family)
MRVGAIIPTTGELPRTIGLARMARMAEDAGAHSLWTNDHILTVTNPASVYPYALGGRPEFPSSQPPLLPPQRPAVKSAQRCW